MGSVIWPHRKQRIPGKALWQGSTCISALCNQQAASAFTSADQKPFIKYPAIPARGKSLHYSSLKLHAESNGNGINHAELRNQTWQRTQDPTGTGFDIAYHLPVTPIYGKEMPGSMQSVMTPRKLSHTQRPLFILSFWRRYHHRTASPARRRTQ